MPVKSMDLITYGKDISCTCELEVRNAVGRMYYGVLHSLKDVLGPIPSYKNTGTHEAVTLYLTESAPETLKIDKNKAKKLAYMLNEIKAKRVRADYHLNEEFDVDEANVVKGRVDQFLVNLGELKPVSPPATMTIQS